MPRSRLLLPALATAVISVTAVFALPASGTARPRGFHLSGCPAHRKAEWQEAKTDRNPRASEATVPMAPSSLQLCHYYGFGAGHQTPQTQARAGELRSERILTKAAEVRSIAREFDALQQVPEGPIHCPFDEGAGSTPSLPTRIARNRRSRLRCISPDARSSGTAAAIRSGQRGS